MKLFQLLVILAAVAVDATQTRRLRRSVRGDVNERYIDLAAEIDESVKERVARRQQKDDLKAARKENIHRELAFQSMSLDGASMSLDLSMDSRVDLSLSLSLSMSLDFRVDPKEAGNPKIADPKEAEAEGEAAAEELSLSLSLSLSLA